MTPDRLLAESGLCEDATIAGTGEHLFTHFDRLAGAPGAVARLRRFVLDLAMRGKLVEQDPNDEPASELLRRIKTEKARFEKQVKLVLQNKQFEKPFVLPSSWEWVPATFPARLISDFGKKVQTKDILVSGKFPVVDQGKIFVRGFCDDAEKVIHVKEPIILFGDHTRETKLIDFDFIVGADGVKLLQPLCLLANYYYLALQWLPLASRGYSRHFKLLRASSLPLPPLAEQHRIFGKVEELMALCDRLEAAQIELEKRHDRLVAASLHRFNQPDAQNDDSRDHARFYLNHLPRLTTRPNQILAIRQTILNFAVRGLLVPQDPNDEPTCELLKRIQQEKSRLIQEGTIRTESQLSEVGEKEKPFAVPANWEWCRLGTLCFLITDGAHHTPRYMENGVPFLSVKDVSGGSIDFSSTRFISEEQHHDLCKRCRPEMGDILLTKVGTTGIAVTVDTEQEFSIFVSLALLKFSHKSLDRFYLRQLINSPLVKRQSADNTRGIGNKNLVLRLIKQFAVPIPPLTEQRRIVAKVDELMTLCDQLEGQLTTAQAHRGRLLEALLHETLAGFAAAI